VVDAAGNILDNNPWVPQPTAVPSLNESATELFDHADQLSLPGPFTILPVPLIVPGTSPEVRQERGIINGYGATTFAYENQHMYDQTHGYHTGMDFFGRDESNQTCKACVRFISICDGHREGGGTTGPDYGQGVAVRCAKEDGSLSNIVVTYNHLTNPTTADWIFAGETIVGSAFQAPPDIEWAPHLHLEVFYWGAYPDDLTNAIRINPSLFFAESRQGEIDANIQAYYPKIGGGSDKLYSSLPFDNDDSDDIDYGITDGMLDRWLPAGDIYGSEASEYTCNGKNSALFWSRKLEGCGAHPGVQRLDTPEAEWTANTLVTISNLIDAINAQ